jgi:predicted O-methyltransferase YrrM
MECVDEQLVENIDHYIERLFTAEDSALSQDIREAAAAGLPAIQVSRNEGKLLYLIAKISGGRRFLEIGTLATARRG